MPQARIYFLVESLHYNDNIVNQFRAWGLDVSIHFRPEDIFGACDRLLPACIVVLMDDSRRKIAQELLKSMKNSIESLHLSMPIIVFVNRPTLSETLLYIRSGANDVISNLSETGSWENVITDWIEESERNRTKNNQTQVACERFSTLPQPVAETAQMLYLGCSNAEIAQATGRKIRTVEQRRAKLMQTMNAHNFAELIRFLGLVLDK